MVLRILARVAGRNVARHWRHSLGTILAIASGFVAIGLFEGYMYDLFEVQSVQLSRRNLLGDIIIEHRDASSLAAREDPLAFALDESAQAAIASYLDARVGDVVARVRTLDVQGMASAGRTGTMVMAIAHDVAEAAKLRGAYAWNARVGRPLHEVPGESMLLAEGLGRVLRCAPTSDEPHLDGRGAPIARERPFKCHRSRVQITAMTERGRVNAVTLDVAGLFASGIKELDNQFALIPLEVGQRLLDTHKITMMTLLLRPGLDAYDWAAQFNASVGATSEVVAVPAIEHRHGELLRRSRELLTVFRAVVVSIVVVIAGSSVLMTTMRAASERTREIGTLRALGYRRRYIVGLFTGEAAVLALVATALGAFTTLVLSLIVNAVGITYNGGVLTDNILLVVAFVPSAYLFAALFLPATAVGAAFVPAWRAARLNIPDSLADR